LLLRAEKADSICRISSAGVDALNLKETTWRTGVSARRVVLAVMRVRARMMSKRINPV
jgi:hypothetical protein